MTFPIQPYDLLMIVVLVGCTAFGAYKGMAWQLAALASLVLSAGVAFHFSSPLASLISVQAPWDRCIAILLLYLATSLVIWLLFRLVSGFIDRVRLNEFDRQIGALFGLAKGVIWCVLITFFAVLLSNSLREKILGTRTGYYTTVLIHRTTPALPEDLREKLGHYIEQYDHRLKATDPVPEPVQVRIPTTADPPD